MHIPEFLAEQKVPFETVVHPPAFTAQRLAKFLHLPGKLIVKSVLLAGPAGYLLAVLPADRQIDVDLITRQLSGAVRLATTGEMASIFRDCEIGAVPAFGSLYGLPTIMDERIDREATIVFEANTHSHAIKMSCKNYERLERPRRLAFTMPVNSPAPAAASETLVPSEVGV